MTINLNDTAASAEVGPIEDNIPIPPSRSHLTVLDKLGLAKMAVGQSRLIRGMTQERVASRASRATQNHGMKFTTRAVEGGVRVWRIK